jgi:TM2 domain-containing membrane protein YozV
MDPNNYCTNCGNPVNIHSQFCTNCGNKITKNRKLNNTIYTNGPRVIYHKPWLATLLSFFLVGLGQFYNGQIFKGTIFVALLYFLISISLYIPTLGFLYLIFWVYILYDAYKNAKKINEKQELFL